MTDEHIKEEIEEKQEILTDALIEEYSDKAEVKKHVRKNYVKRISSGSATVLVRLVFGGKLDINISDIAAPESLVRHNLSLFNKDNTFKLEFLKQFREEMSDYLVKFGRELEQYDKDKHKGVDPIKVNGSTYVLRKEVMYDRVVAKTCEEDGDIEFTYDFDNPDMPKTIPETTQTLQRCLIQILSKETKFGYPIQFTYVCPECNHRSTMKAHMAASTRNRVRCPNIIANATGDRMRRCNTSLVPYDAVSLTKDTFYYRISYDNATGEKITADAHSFIDLRPGFYECVLYKLGNPRKTEEYHIMDVKDIGSNVFNMPPKIQGENYLYTLQKAFDSFIKRQTNVEIWGLNPMKVSLILQCMMSYLGFKLLGNVQLVGDASVGKSLLLKYYGFLLYNHLNLSTNGLSVSVAGLRGTKQTITLLGRDYKIVTTGHLGTFKSIHIDEAGENKILVQNLKTFMLEDNYSYDKAGATGVFNKRTAHVNISENLDHQHVGQYRGAIRKAYKDMNITIEGENREEWDEHWDLHQPLYVYNNPYLQRIVKEKRVEYIQKKIFWLDGYDYALHERFPFYFYLVNEKKNIQLSEVVKENARKNTVSENSELMKQLRADSIEQFFISLNKYIKTENDIEGFDKVDEILENYDIQADARMKNFFYVLLRLSRIANRRFTYEEEDFHLVKWIIESTGRKIDVADTNDYEIQGPPDIKAFKERQREIEDKMTEVDGQFGLPAGEFDD